MPIHFDESLPKLCQLISQEVGTELLSRSAIVRDAGGRLFIVIPAQIEQYQKERLTSKLLSELGCYVRQDSPMADISYPGAGRLLEEAAKQPYIRIGELSVKLLDRRIVGSEWLRSPSPIDPKIPRIVFSSLKGGVGRSTALCIAAAHFSRKGFRVLAIDFDLEAPGIGTMLLDEDELPRYGMLDYLVEAGLCNVDDNFFTELAGDSFLGAGGARVTVIPAIGQSTLTYPENALAKIARAYLDVPQEDGPPKTITDQLVALLAHYDSLEAYDVVLVDGRSGLHETAASLILGLGAEVLLFGLDQPQTFQGYRLLMGQLSRHPFSPSNDWREKLSFVHAKASDALLDREEAASRFQAIFDSLLQPNASEQAEPERLTEDDFEIEWQETANELADDLIEVEVLHVLEDTIYRRFDPIGDRRILDVNAYTTAFGSLLEYLDSVVDDARVLEDGQL